METTRGDGDDERRWRRRGTKQKTTRDEGDDKGDEGDDERNSGDAGDDGEGRGKSHFDLVMEGRQATSMHIST